MWINLIGNAIKFAAEGSVIEVDIREHSQSISVSILNQGVEISPEDQKRVFNKFYQADRSHASEGSGIGLAIVKRIVELHKGKISLVSEKGLTVITVDLQFRDSEFVSILGPSGCGKTTMLNIIGGLDQYSEGDLVIGDRSTKDFKDRDWDAYRNHSIGFVFQSYNLIPHQIVLQNVELALTLSGVSKAERRQRAVAALEKVGLGTQLGKRPSEMSGGQMQRVAIARAIVNDPDIILADEPTGALDTQTSVQVMDILKDIAQDRLVIMVTHNPELAEKYSTRIIRMLDGNITDDSSPLTQTEIDHDVLYAEFAQLYRY